MKGVNKSHLVRLVQKHLARTQYTVKLWYKRTRRYPKYRRQFQLIVGTLVLLVLAAGTISARYLVERQQDLQQQASGCGYQFSVTCGNGLSATGDCFMVDTFGGNEQAYCSTVCGNEGGGSGVTSCSKTAVSTGGGGGGGGGGRDTAPAPDRSNTCSSGGATAQACYGVSVGGGCKGFAGRCWNNGATDNEGYAVCGCVANEGSVGQGGFCTANNQCQAGLECRDRSCQPPATGGNAGPTDCLLPGDRGRINVGESRELECNPNGTRTIYSCGDGGILSSDTQNCNYTPPTNPTGECRNVPVEGERITMDDGDVIDGQCANNGQRARYTCNDGNFSITAVDDNQCLQEREDSRGVTADGQCAAQTSDCTSLIGYRDSVTTDGNPVCPDSTPYRCGRRPTTNIQTCTFTESEYVDQQNQEGSTNPLRYGNVQLSLGETRPSECVPGTNKQLVFTCSLAGAKNVTFLDRQCNISTGDAAARGCFANNSACMTAHNRNCVQHSEIPNCWVPSTQTDTNNTCTPTFAANDGGSDSNRCEYYVPN